MLRFLASAYQYHGWSYNAKGDLVKAPKVSLALSIERLYSRHLYLDLLDDVSAHVAFTVLDRYADSRFRL